MPRVGWSSRARVAESASPSVERNYFFSQCPRDGYWQEFTPHSRGDASTKGQSITTDQSLGSEAFWKCGVLFSQCCSWREPVWVLGFKRQSRSPATLSKVGRMSRAK